MIPAAALLFFWGAALMVVGAQAPGGWVFVRLVLAGAALMWLSAWLLVESGRR